MTIDIDAIHAQQIELGQAIWDMNETDARIASLEYGMLVGQRLVHLGPNVDAHLIDPWMADTYSDLYKDRYGTRPRGHSYATMKAWMDNIPPLEPQDDELDIADWEINPSDVDDSTMIKLLDFQEVYGISAMSQAMKFMDMKEY